MKKLTKLILWVLVKQKIKSNIAQLVHQADMIATRYEMERYMFSEDANIPYGKIMGVDVETTTKNASGIVGQSQPKSKSKVKPMVDKEYKNKLFDELFGDKK